MLIFTSNRLIVIIVQSLANSRLQVKAQMKDLLVFIVAAKLVKLICLGWCELSEFIDRSNSILKNLSINW
jgi:hypothetical protein